MLFISFLQPISGDFVSRSIRVLKTLPSEQGGIGIAQQSAQGDVGIVHRVRKVSWVT